MTSKTSKLVSIDKAAVDVTLRSGAGDIGGYCGKILELLGYRLDKFVTESAVAAGCGLRRWDGHTLYSDWHLDRVV